MKLELAIVWLGVSLSAYGEEGVQSESPLQYRVLSSQAHHKGGKKITIQKVAPPTLDQLRNNVRSERVSEQKRIKNNELNEVLPAYSFIVSVTRYDDSFSIVNWWSTDAGRWSMSSCVSNIDWRHLAGFWNFQAQGNDFTFILFNSSESLQNLEALKKQGSKVFVPDVPSDFLKTKTQEPRYVMLGANGGSPFSVKFMEAIHKKYGDERKEFSESYQRRLKARKLKLRKASSKPKDVAIRYWRRAPQSNLITK